jgi:rhodanese-related sulfurtransferase
MVRLLSTLLLAALAFGQTESQKQNLTPEEIEKALARKDVFFLDVREPKEIAELGSVKGYVNIPLGQLESRFSEIPKDKLVLTL